MLFNSYIFVFAFLPVVLLAWWSVSSRTTRLAILTLASCLFYGWWDWRFVPLMLVSASADFVAGALLVRVENSVARRAILVCLLVFNLGTLAVFKYADFLLETVAFLGATEPLPHLGIVLPVGISFYTFNSISYTVDVYRRRVAPARNPLEFISFVVMFPHLVAGPIVRFADMAEQLRALPTKLSQGAKIAGSWFFVLGLAKKLLIADPIAAGIVDPLFHDTSSLGFAAAWLAAVAYSIQLYFDFSGYSDMAVGLALFLGLRFPQNFDSPYQAANPSEFWRRWHMSLSFWLRDYVFIGLGGSRGTIYRTIINLTITMFLGGLWHGASWTFVAWGLYHGLLLAIHAAARARGLVPQSRALSVALTFIAVVVGWVLFRSASFAQAQDVLAAMFLGGAGALSGLNDVVGLRGVVVLVVGAAIALMVPNTWQVQFPRSRWSAVALAALFVCCVLHFEAESPFLYFQF